jgi:signal transduction histidine kinase
VGAVMRERVEMYGGELRWGPRAGGGYEVRARLPRSYDQVPA